MYSRLLHIIILALALASPAPALAQINTEQVLRVGQNALYFEDYVLSIQYFNQVIQAKPYLAQPYLMRAIAKLNLDDYPGAEADASTAVAINPFLPDAWEVRGVARQNQGNSLGAISDYDQALALLPNNKQIMFNKALAQSDTKQYGAADSTFTLLLRHYPGFDKAYLGRARLHLENKDTISAAADIDKALEINENALNGYIMRAAIAIDKHGDFEKALSDMDRAIKLEPRLAGLYVNRAFLRYSLDDYFGAKADFDYALQLEPLNQAALFNRSLLLMEVGDNDHALIDLNTLVELDPDDVRAAYNRSVVHGEKRDYASAIADISRVIDRYPGFSSAYFLRSEFYRQQGDMRKAEADYNKAMDMVRSYQKSQPAAAQGGSPAGDAPADELASDVPEELTPEAAARRFNALLTIDNDTRLDEEYNNSAIRGRVQDRNLQIEIEPLVELSLYSSPSELGENTYYIKEVDDLNSTRMLRSLIFVTPRPVQLNDPGRIQRHFESVDYYTSYIATHTPRTIDYVGRALDLVTVKNYEAAIADLDRALQLSPDYAVAYMLRAQARYHLRPSEEESSMLSRRARLLQVLADYDKAIELSPRTAVLWFDKGNVLFQLDDYTSALAAYSQAIDLQPNMGEAYFNRGYVYLKLGNQPAGVADLSKAGELGIISAYNLLKRIR